MNLDQIFVGTDPEFFSTINLDGKEVAISPALLNYHGVINQLDGTEKHPEFIITPQYIWHGDGVAWEVKFNYPFENGLQLSESLKISLDHLEEFLSKRTFMDQPLKLFKKPVVDIDLEMYKKYLDVHSVFMGFIFGCDADKDAIDLDYNCKTINAVKHPLRYGGGHAHFSIKNDDRFVKFPQVAIQLLAIYFGNYFVYNSPYREQDLIRVQTYGRPGRYREQIYSNNFSGVEYRTPSNSWASISPDEIDVMFESGKIALSLFDRADKVTEIINDYLQDTIKAIINSDKNLSKRILSSLGVL